MCQIQYVYPVRHSKEYRSQPRIDLVHVLLVCAMWCSPHENPFIGPLVLGIFKDHFGLNGVSIEWENVSRSKFPVDVVSKLISITFLVRISQR